jgi:hypothetical protein
MQRPSTIDAAAQQSTSATAAIEVTDLCNGVSLESSPEQWRA